MSVRVILLIFLRLSSAFRIAENVVFEKTQDITVARSKWVFSFFTDLRSHRTYMNRLQNDMKRAESIVDQVIIASRNKSFPHYYKLYVKQKQELMSLKPMYTTARRELADIVDLQEAKRSKRALLPFAGKALSWLTGTLTKKDLRKVYRHIDSLSKNQAQIVHVLEDTLSVLNVTNVRVRENRHAIRVMTDAIEKLDRRLANITYVMQHYMNNLNSFLVTYLQVDLMITELHESVEKAMFYIDSVKMGMDQLSLGHLAPSVIRPTELKRILVDIQGKVPKRLTLPAPVEHIWYYYKTLNCVTIIKNKRFVTLVNLPLLELNAGYEVYQVYNIPLPYLDTHMTAAFEIETNVIAVSEQHTDYFLPTELDLARCGNPTATFCALRKPVYRLGSSKLCIASLFRRNRAAIQQNCRTRVQLDAMLPQAVYVPDGNWLVVSNRPLSFTLMCLAGESRQLATKPPISYLQLEPACEAYADGIKLPPFYFLESHYGHTWQRETLLTLQNTSAFSIWAPLDEKVNSTPLSTLTDLPDLQEIPDIPLDTLLNKLDAALEPEMPKLRKHWKEYVMVASIALLTLGLTLVVIRLKFLKGKSLLNLCLSALAKRRITEADTDQKTGREGAASVDPSVENAYSQSREVCGRDATETLPHKMSPLLLELSSLP